MRRPGFRPIHPRHLEEEIREMDASFIAFRRDVVSSNVRPNKSVPLPGVPLSVLPEFFLLTLARRGGHLGCIPAS